MSWSKLHGTRDEKKKKNGDSSENNLCSQLYFYLSVWLCWVPFGGLWLRLFKSRKRRTQRIKCSQVGYFHFAACARSQLSLSLFHPHSGVQSVHFPFFFFRSSFHCYRCPRYKCHKLKGDIIVALCSVYSQCCVKAGAVKIKNYYNTLVVRHLFIFLALRVPLVFFFLLFYSISSLFNSSTNAALTTSTPPFFSPFRNGRFFSAWNFLNFFFLFRNIFHIRDFFLSFK